VDSTQLRRPGDASPITDTQVQGDKTRWTNVGGGRTRPHKRLTAGPRECSTAVNKASDHDALTEVRSAALRLAEASVHAHRPAPDCPGGKDDPKADTAVASLQHDAAVQDAQSAVQTAGAGRQMKQPQRRLNVQTARNRVLDCAGDACKCPSRSSRRWNLDQTRSPSTVREHSWSTPSMPKQELQAGRR